jgi:acetyl esterase/lipase
MRRPAVRVGPGHQGLRREEHDMHQHRATRTTSRWISIFVALGTLVALVATGDAIVASPVGAARTTTSAKIRVSDVEPVPPLVTGVAYGPFPEQLLDVHLPTNRSGPFPVMIYAHSGGWVAGSRDHIPDFLLQQVDRAGLALVSIDYRLVTSAPDGSRVNAFPVPNQDVDRAIRFVKAHAGVWHLDPTHVLLAGASAGGHLAALAAAAPGVFVDPKLPADLASISPTVDGVLDFVGVSDLTTFGQAGGWAPGLMSSFLDCPAARYDLCDPAKIAAASVAPHLGTEAPPAFLVYGVQDGLVEAATQGVPLAQTWANARNAVPKPVTAAGVELEQVDCGHNVEASDLDMSAMETWIDAVIASTSSTATLARAARGHTVNASAS